MKNESIATAEIETLGRVLKIKLENAKLKEDRIEVSSINKQLGIYNSVIRLLNGGKYNSAYSGSDSAYVKGRKLSELKSIPSDTFVMSTTTEEHEKRITDLKIKVIRGQKWKGNI